MKIKKIPFLQGLKRYMRVEQNVVSDRHINTAANVGRMFYFLQRSKHRNIQLDPSGLLKKDLIRRFTNHLMLGHLL